MPPRKSPRRCGRGRKLGGRRKRDRFLLPIFYQAVKGLKMRIWNGRLKRSFEVNNEVFLCELKKHLRYDPETGHWWRLTPTRYTSAGARAEKTNCAGYLIVHYGGKHHGAQTLAYFYMTAVWPPVLVDHRNRIRNDNRWNNLRLATYRQNAANSKKRKDNTSGFKGVAWSKRKKLWGTCLRTGRKTHLLGFFDCRPAAHFAYVIAADIYHGEFACAE